MSEEQSVKIDQIVFREDLYQRIKKDPVTVQKYAEDLSVLPPIEVNQHNELIDGWHRWTAHKKNDIQEIAVIVTQTNSDIHFIELAIERNSKYGLQLSQEDKRSIARRIYHSIPVTEREVKKEKLSHIFSVSLRTIQNWLSRIDKDDKEQRDVAALNKWFACYTQKEIAKAFGITQQAIELILQGNERFRFLVKPGELREIEDKVERWQEIEKLRRDAAFYQTDFTIPLYNVWKQKEKQTELNHHGLTEPLFVDNLLYLYTNPFDTVVDPFAGSGTTIDICKKRFRRYWVSDRKPIIERESEISKHDITGGLPALPRWKDVKLVYLDPPYWKQAEGQYSKDSEDLANMPLDQFNNVLAELIKGFSKKLTNAYIALIIQPTQWNAPDRIFTDHIGDMLRTVKLPVDLRYSVPYESQQNNAQMVEWAKQNKKCLVLTREIIVWRVE